MRTLVAGIFIVLLLATTACGREPGGVPLEAQQRLALLELEAFAATVADRREVGALPDSAASAVADRLVAEISTPQAPASGETAAAGKLKFAYVRESGNGPWQIVLHADDKKEMIELTAYGATAGTVLATRTISLE